METRIRPVYLAWLASGGLSPAAVSSLLSEHEPEEIYALAMSGKLKSLSAEISDKPAETLVTNGADKFLNTWERLIAQLDIRTMVRGDGNYPESLESISDPPAILFYRGSLEALNHPSAAMVGSRNASWKGTQAAEKTAEKLSANGISIISGLAYGIDAAAHKGCLKGGSPTVAVMGCGVDQEYPADHARLKRQILENGGLIISEYSPGEKPLGWHFPIRNRIISALADCLAVMEARIRSGSMTTVQHALDQGKDVFVYPGEPGNPACEGNHQLLREGAIYFTSAEDIMEDMHWLDKKEETGQNSGASSGWESLSPAERAVAEQLSRGEQSLDQLCEALKTPPGPLMSLLTMMQIRGIIEPMPGKLYRIHQE